MYHKIKHSSTFNDINEWYQTQIVGRDKIKINSSNFIEDLYKFCQKNNAFCDPNLLDSIESVSIDYLYFGKVNVNFGFVHHQILKHVKYFRTKFIEDNGDIYNRQKFRNMFKNYKHFNLREIKLKTFYWQLDDILKCIVDEQPEVFLHNNNLQLVEISCLYHDDVPTIPPELYQFYKVEIKSMRRTIAQGEKSYYKKVVLKRLPMEK